jgi:apolipoprotein N-acyltransferase
MDFGLCGLAGALQGLSMALPVQVGHSPSWWLQMLGMLMFLYVLQKTPHAFLATLIYGSSWMGASCWWLYVSMHTYGGLNGFVSFSAVAALSTLLSLYYVGCIAIYQTVIKSETSTNFQRKNAPGLLAALWTLAEVARGTWLSGFGWGGIGYAHIEGPLSVWAPWLGVYGTTAIASYLCAACAGFIGAARTSHKHIRTLAAVVLLTLGLNVFKPEFTQSNGFIDVALLQGNIPQDEKFADQTGVQKALTWYPLTLKQQTSSLVIAPETAIPLLPQQLPKGYLEQLKPTQEGADQATQKAILIGLPLGGHQQGYTNSVVALNSKAQTLWQYDKHHLVPFGEFTPQGMRWFTEMMSIPLGDFKKGLVNTPSFSWRQQEVAANICYEDLFTEELAQRFDGTHPAPTIWVNFSNLAWFGDTVAMDQHLHISRMRALEFERPFVKSSNTGITAVVNHKGEVTHQLERLKPGVLLAEVEGRTGTTPYAYWSARWGVLPIWLLSGLWVVWCAYTSRRLRK